MLVAEVATWSAVGAIFRVAEPVFGGEALSKELITTLNVCEEFNVGRVPALKSPSPNSILACVS